MQHSLMTSLTINPLESTMSLMTPEQVSAAAKEIAGYFGIVTDIFLRLIKMLIGPLVFSTLVVGIVVWLAGLNPGVKETVEHAGFAKRLGRERLLFNARAAVEHYQTLYPKGEAASGKD